MFPVIQVNRMSPGLDRVKRGVSGGRNERDLFLPSSFLPTGPAEGRGSQSVGPSL